MIDIEVRRRWSNPDWLLQDVMNSSPEAISKESLTVQAIQLRLSSDIREELRLQTSVLSALLGLALQREAEAK